MWLHMAAGQQPWPQRSMTAEGSTAADPAAADSSMAAEQHGCKSGLQVTAELQAVA
jgi:hypothetical protein